MPDYAKTGIPQEEINSRSGPIEVKSKEEIDVLREICVLGRLIYISMIKYNIRETNFGLWP